MTDLEPTISIIRSDIYCPNTLLKRQGYSDYIKKEAPPVCYIQKTNIRHKYRDSLLQINIFINKLRTKQASITKLLLHPLVGGAEEL